MHLSITTSYILYGSRHVQFLYIIMKNPTTIPQRGLNWQSSRESQKFWHKWCSLLFTFWTTYNFLKCPSFFFNLQIYLRIKPHPQLNKLLPSPFLEYQLLTMESVWLGGLCELGLQRSLQQQIHIWPLLASPMHIIWCLLCWVGTYGFLCVSRVLDAVEHII